ncbi:hypothetical protein B0T16DRAFT_425778 [Cercophora newfieldiana]|uniref:Uncharacterized protein n=1 Tax=Cercophora newfieldiana TaxID=92897 RepID=A0AA39YS43_9PEZI|nr:hypothetical protein B0T16DRAFT_425778 [Cercophora newfieldiana]
MNQHSGAATLPRGFRYSAFEAPRTPEPLSQNDENQLPRLPSPPRPRLKLKRRVVSQLSAPTQQFLASVAAADVPIPSIEEPEAEPRDFDMSGIFALTRQIHGDDDRDAHLLRPRGRTFSPPKTPAPDCVPSLSPTRYPNWTIDSAISSVESTPEYESSRPSTSRSTQTSASLFSRISHLSDDCGDFEEDVKDRYVLSPDDDIGLRGAADLKKGKKLRKAPWTKAMSDHLWSTFMLYLQDPKVTPFRMAKNSIPPHGVMLRVSREAKRSWKGSKALTKASNPSEGRKSGSSTPTAESSGAFIQWPHTCAATRGHLRELCRLRAASGAKNRGFLSRSPTPFNQAAARHWNRRSTPARGPSAFAQDMSMSLALSTSESMQPQGPLAQLTGSSPGPIDRAESPAFSGTTLTTFEGEPSFAERQERQRLGSPFGARSYGPSSSNSLAAALGLNSPMPRRLTHTVGPRRTLQSPVRLSRSSTQKRRHTQSSEPRKRPTMGLDMWIDPNSRAGPVIEATRSAEFSSTNSGRLDDPFVPRIPAEPMLSTSTSMPNVAAQLSTPQLPPPRLGSPFSAATTSTSFSFPNRIHRMHQGGSVDLGMLGRPFATFQQGADSSSTQSTRPGLVGRLAYIDQRLKEFNRHDSARRRSESPL